jgi:hypothetical protein
MTTAELARIDRLSRTNGLAVVCGPAGWQIVVPDVDPPVEEERRPWPLNDDDDPGLWPTVAVDVALGGSEWRVSP